MSPQLPTLPRLDLEEATPDEIHTYFQARMGVAAPPPPAAPSGGVVIAAGGRLHTGASYSRGEDPDGRGSVAVPPAGSLSSGRRRRRRPCPSCGHRTHLRSCPRRERK